MQHVLPANLRGVCGVTCNFLISEVSNTGFPALLESGDVISSSGLLLGQHITKLFHTIVGADTSKYNIVLHLNLMSIIGFCEKITLRLGKKITI